MVDRPVARLVLLVTAAFVPVLSSALNETDGGKAEPEKRDQTPGSFNRPLKSSEAAKGGHKGAPATTTSCLNTNTQCLLGCPSTDESAELACSNRCRANLQTCKARAKKATLPKGG
jgi:hypothetical protein